jgi:hypothetical protein
MIWLGVSGAHRSGTTILSHTLNQHPEIGLFVEYGLERYVRAVDAIFARSDEIEAYDSRVQDLISTAPAPPEAEPTPAPSPPAAVAAEPAASPEAEPSPVSSPPAAVAAALPAPPAAGPSPAPSPPDAVAAEPAASPEAEPSPVSSPPAAVAAALPASPEAEPSPAPSPPAAVAAMRPAPRKAVPPPAPRPSPARVDAFYQQRDVATAPVLVHTGPFRPTRQAHGEDMLLAAYRLVFPDRALRVIGDKMPQFWDQNDLAWLQQRLPNFRLLQIVRNPLDVINSSLHRRNKMRAGKDLWHIATVDQAASEWIAEWNRAITVKAVMGDDMLVVKYADMAHDGDAVLRRIEAFLGLSQPLVPAFLPIPDALRLHAMTADERAQAEAWFRPVTDVWSDTDTGALFARFPALAPVSRCGETLHFRADGNAHACDLAGFFDAEPEGTWTDGPHAEVAANFGLGTLRCQLRGGCILAPCCERLRVLVNGVEAGTVTAAEEPWQAIEFVLDFDHTATATGATVIRFEPDRPKRPEEDPTDDIRPIGAFLKWLRLERL